MYVPHDPGKGWVIEKPHSILGREGKLPANGCNLCGFLILCTALAQRDTCFLVLALFRNNYI